MAESVPDVTGAGVRRGGSAGRWYLLPDNTVVYHRPSGERAYPAVIDAATLEISPTWIEVHD